MTNPQKHAEAPFAELQALLSPETIRPGESVIQANGLTKKFGKTHVLNNLTLRVPRGSVYGLLGRNGAGKSTLIQLLLGALEPDSGSISVLGLDPAHQGLELRRRIGYIPEHLSLYDWMTVGQTLGFVGAQYKNWSVGTQDELLDRFHLPRDRKVKALSRGQRALLGLVLAMAHDPELVLLDECTSGMDALARADFDRCVITALQDTGRTVLFATHQLREMERLCDWVGIIHGGKMLLEMPVDALKQRVKMLRVIDMEDERALPRSVQILDQRRYGREWLLTVDDYDPDVLRGEFPLGGRVGEVIDLSLEDIFTALMRGLGEH